MATETKLSLPTAILISLNIMMGGGIFINTVELAKRAGALSGFMYPLIGLLIAPLMLSIAALIRLHPAGGFYVFGQKEINPFVGYLSTWSYFVAKLASASLMIHVAVSLITQIFPGLLNFGSLLFYDLLVVTFFIVLNTLNMRTGSRIQFGFLGFKLIPVLFVIAAGLFYFAPTHAHTFVNLWEGIPSSLPLVLYAAMGFEAICALSSKIENPEKNGPRSITISFLTMMLLVFLFQFLFYATLGNTLAEQNTFLDAFPALLNYIMPGMPYFAHALQIFFNLAIAISALGGCYGILYSNNWNLHILAQHKKISGYNWLSQLNSHGIPVACLFIEWLLCVGFLYFCAGKQVVLQQMAALGTALTYCVCVIALLRAYKRSQKPFSKMLIPYVALLSCSVLIGACIRNFYFGGIYPLFGFILLLLAGLLLYRKSKG